MKHPNFLRLFSVIKKAHDMRARLIVCMFAGLLLVQFSCRKDRSTKPGDPVTVIATGKSIYSDSVFYINNVSSKYLVNPVKSEAGSYSCVPLGLELDQVTGEIDVNKSETGLKYRVTFTPDDGSEPKTSDIIISGLNYMDKIYNLSAGDSIAPAIYNADLHLNIPGAGSTAIFDEGGGCRNAGIVIDGRNAEINLAQTIRNQGIDTGATQEVKLVYRINDNSHSALNGLSVKIYFYRDASEIPQYLSALLIERKNTIITSSAPKSGLIINSLAVNKTQQLSRPRPPCIVVVSR